MWQKLLASLILCFIAVTHPLQAFAQQTQLPPVPQPPQDYYWHGPWRHIWGDGYGWHFWWMFPLMMLCMIVIFAVIFFFARGLCGYGSHHWGPPSRMWGDDPSHSALRILNERFARGEIQNDEYTEKKTAILSGG